MKPILILAMCCGCCADRTPPIEALAKKVLGDAATIDLGKDPGDSDEIWAKNWSEEVYAFIEQPSLDYSDGLIWMHENRTILEASGLSIPNLLKTKSFKLCDESGACCQTVDVSKQLDCEVGDE